MKRWNLYDGQTAQYKPRPSHSSYILGHKSIPSPFLSLSLTLSLSLSLLDKGQHKCPDTYYFELKNHQSSLSAEFM